MIFAFVNLCNNDVMTVLDRFQPPSHIRYHGCPRRASPLPCAPLQSTAMRHQRRGGREAHPAVVTAVVAELAASDLTLAALGGQMGVQGDSGRAPVRPTTFNT